MARITGLLLIGLTTALTLTGCAAPQRGSLASIDHPDSGAIAESIIDQLVIGEVMMRSELAENLRALSVPGGRLSGTPNGHDAETYVAKQLRAYGLENVHLEPFAMPGWQSQETTVTLEGPDPIKLENAIALWNTLSTPGDGVILGLLDVGHGKPEEFAALAPDALRGRLALVRDGGGPSRSDKARMALEAGAAGMLVVGRPEREPVMGSCYRTPRAEPAVVVRHDDGVKLAEQLAAGQDPQVRISILADVWDARPHNVVGELPGNGPLADQVVILGAHLDSWHLAEGAIDNGIGAAAILESARALAATGWKPRRTVRFVWFMGEEQGLYGSRAYVDAHTDELDKIVTMVNADMPGSPRRFVTFGHEEIIPFLETLRTDLAAYEIAEKIQIARNGDWSDHAPFAAAGICALCVPGDIGDGGRHYHTTGDVYEITDRRATNEAAAVLAVLIRRLADADKAPGQRITPETQPTGAHE